MIKGKTRRALRVLPLSVAVVIVAGCGGEKTVENAGSRPVQAPPLAEEAMPMSSTLIELRHFDVYQYYRDVFSTRTESSGASGTAARPSEVKRKHFACLPEDQGK